MIYRNYGFLFLLLASSLSAVLMIFAFPNYNQAWLAWVALVPLLCALAGRKPIHGFLVSGLWGIIFCAEAFRFIFEVPGYKILHHIFLDLYLGVLYGLFGFIFCFIGGRWGIAPSFFAAPFIWVSVEYLRSNLSFLALPWVLLSHSQLKVLNVIQISGITGAYGVSFLIVMVNATFAAMIWFALKKLSASAGNFPSISRLGVAFVVSCTVLSMLCTLVYGGFALSQVVDGPKVRISVVQGNIDREKKRNPKNHTDFIMQKYANLSKEAARNRPDLIVWPEAATPGFVLKDSSLLARINTLIRNTKSYYLMGSSEYPKFAKVSTKEKNTANTALFFSPKGKLLGQYLKIRLLPFGEYIPFEHAVPWPEFIIAKNRKIQSIRGKEFTLFKLNRGKFGVLICWEIVFPELVRTYVNKGANFMVNITNEGWFGETTAPYQMLSICVFRAVENRLPIVRAANTGISCFIDPFGRITEKVKKDGRDIFVEGFITQEVISIDERSFFAVYGYLFIYAVLSITIILTIVTIFKKPDKSNLMSMN